MIRFAPRVLGSFEVDVTLFIDHAMSLDAVERSFDLFADVFRRGQFQIIRVFLHVAVNDMIIEIPELFDMEFIIMVQTRPLVGNRVFRSLRIKLEL
ncbi:hypothetical protein SDC9_203968 [bioreactor metagenome]|uniref:Uncharacterized protein n=1 Tax=bioreactor metagenome TaxID=1076179 RepID=A0A645IZI8_9ZZZZ